ncbi:putative glycosyltransferase [Pedobacter sp. UYEF25]
MRCKVGFYIHHHGSGHLMTALAISKQLSADKIFFLGSNLKPYQSIIPDHISCVHLPIDISIDNEGIDESSESCENFHYAPINVKGIRTRNHLITGFFVEQYPLILVVDTCPELVALARLCGIPTILIQQHGERNDLAHLLSYDSATEIIAPFPEKIRPQTPLWVHQKTFYSGGFSKYDSVSVFNKERSDYIGILIGTGGTSLNIRFVIHLAESLPSFNFKAIGEMGNQETGRIAMPKNLVFTGFVENPEAALTSCKIVIGNAGHNTVMEMATMRKRFICVPEERPFFEQIDKADKIRDAFGIVIVLPAKLYTTNWDATIRKLAAKKANWKGMINPRAVKNICDRIQKLATTLFKLN